MGVDATILIKTTMTTDEISNEIYFGRNISIYEIRPDLSIYGETHEICTYFRYYNTYYTRGHWGGICSILMECMQSEKIEKVWYGADGNCTECTIEDILDTSQYYMKHGNRPYHT